MLYNSQKFIAIDNIEMSIPVGESDEIWSLLDSGLSPLSAFELQNTANCRVTMQSSLGLEFDFFF